MTSRKRQATRALDVDLSSCIQGHGSRKRRMMTAQNVHQAGLDAACFMAFPLVTDGAQGSAVPGPMLPGPALSGPELPGFDNQYIDLNQMPAATNYARPQAPAAPAPAQPLLLVAGHSMEELGIAIPCYLPDDQSEVLHRAVHKELEYQRQNPPKLPPSQVPDLPPKKAMPQYLSASHGADDEEIKKVQEHNNSVSAKIQRLDRERNNQAAKKSRATRIETLEEYRRLYILTTAMLWYHRLRDAATGLDPDAWERLSPRIRQDLVRMAEDAARAVENDKIETKKRDEAHRRVQRGGQKRTCRRRALAAASRNVATASPVSVGEDGSELFEVVTPERDLGKNPYAGACENHQESKVAPVADMSFAEPAWVQWDPEA
ncbi:hypothetical protein XA68_17971 [Ophiocordyceps unilateralis]|uniref:BZIP domain-containing protein n=1 Tax=Ophiocordyceps unilateralis TaxID=268505 RepID=A0A2A9PK69_OPHUN|nr:hypothetical protein XA68_17971 [Ophiocordyceps unilateralis]